VPAAPAPAPLPPEERRGNRERLIAAMAASIERQGYRSTSVAEVVRIARTSRRTFYENFDDRDGCFLALFEATIGEMMHAIAGAVSFEGEWEAQVDAAIGVYLDSVAKHPALFQSFANELPGIGRAGAERARSLGERFADLLVELVDAGRRERPDIAARALPRETAVIIVGGLRELIVTTVANERDVSELRASAAGAVKAIMRAVVLEPEAETVHAG
jgi:AcrR family transcriptional regulator